jgi:hypothetical protein
MKIEVQQIPQNMKEEQEQEGTLVEEKEKRM